MKRFGTKSFKACGCKKKSCNICTIPDNATKLIFHTMNKPKKTRNKIISLKTQEKYVISKDWSTWYNKNYWVNPKTIVDSNLQDYTDYGMDLNSAYCFEKLKLPKFIPCFLPILSQQSQGLANKKKIQGLLKQLEKSRN